MKYKKIFLYLIFLITICSCNNNLDESNGTTNTKQIEADSIADCMYDLYEQGKFSESVIVGEKALRCYENLNDTLGISDVIGSIANAYQRLGNISASLEMSLRAYKLDSIMDDKERMSSDFNTLAVLYLTEKQPLMAEKFILRAIEYEEMTESQSRLSNRYGIASEIFSQMGNQAKAEEYATKGYSIAESAKDSVTMGIRMVQLADVYLSENKFNEAENLYLRYIGMPSHLQKNVSLAITYKQLGILYQKTDLKSKAIDAYTNSIKEARKVGYLLVLEKSLNSLGNLYAEDNPRLAVSMLRESRVIADSLNNSKVADILASYAARNDLQEKENTINQQAAELRAHRIITYFSASLLVLIIITSIVIVSLKRLRRRHEKLEAKYSEKVVEQNLHNEVEIPQSDRDFLNKLSEYIEAHMHESGLTSATLADEFCVSQRQFARRIKQVTGIDTTHYIRASRILRARRLLKDESLSITDIYVRCGFESITYFSRVFHQDVGVSPTEYRKNGINIEGED